MLDLVVHNAIIVTMEPDCEPFVGYIGVKDGKIAALGAGDVPDALETIDAQRDIVFPGMINGHCHGDMTVMRGDGDEMTLFEQNLKYADNEWYKESIGDEGRYLSRQLTYIEAISSGTTFIMENMFWSLGLKSVDAMKSTGIKGALAEDVRVDFSNPDKLIDEDYLSQFSDYCRQNDIIPILAGPAEEDFSISLLKNVKNLACKFGLPVTCHLAETKWRMKICREKFGMSPIAFMEKTGFLDDITLLGSHSVYTDEQDREIMRENKLYPINTPLCEMKINDGVAPIMQYLNDKIPVGLGTDGAMWNNSNDMFREVKATVLLQSVTNGAGSISARTALEMATINGAKIFGVDDKIGSLKVGKCADFIIIDTKNPALRPLKLNGKSNVLSTIAFCTVGRDVRDTYINGKAVMKNRKIVSCNAEKIVMAAENIRNNICEI